MKKTTLALLFFILLFSKSILLGQVQKDTITLTEIMLQGTPIKTSLQNATSAVSVITQNDLAKNDGVILTPILNTIPGVFMQQGSLNTNRISIRGIGARSQYGTTKIKAYFEDIPLTNGEGETTVEDIDLESIGSIEIIKGPNSTSFGSGLGGVIHLLPRETAQESFGKSNTTFGSFGLIKQSLLAGYSNQKSNLFAGYTHLQNDGFRDNSAYDRKSFNVHGKQQISQKGSLTYLVIFTRLKAFIPSSINESDFLNQPEKAAATWAAAKGNESYDKFMMGIGYKHQFTEKWFVKTSIFSNFKKGNEDRPFDILKDKTNTLGFRANLNYKNVLFQLPFEMSLGTEFLAEKQGVSLFKNLYQSQPGQGSIKGDEFSTIHQDRKYINYFFELQMQLTPKLYLESGLALNSTRYSLETLLPENNTNPDNPSSFGNVWSPRMGLSYKIAKDKNTYFSVSKGFSIPSVAETLTPEGTINTSLKPEIGWNYEMGFKGNWLNRVYTEIAFYYTPITNLLVARRTANDQYVGINAGETSHKGIELLVNYSILKSSKWQLSSYVSGTINHFKYKNFIDGENDYSGNALTGVPKTQLNLGLDFSGFKGFRLNTSFRTVGETPMNDANTKYTDYYQLLDIKTVYAFTLFKHVKTEFSAGINNALNRHYAASILTNAVGFGNTPARFYYPGNPRNYYGGIAVSYLF